MLIASRVIDRHNELSGLSNDDHPQYVHTTIQRTITSSPIFSSASSSAVSINIKRISGQTGRLLNIISESDSDLANIDANGNLFVAGTISGTIDVSNLTGLISTSVLGTGTANSGTFLRGDNTWSNSLNSGTIISPNPFILSQTWNNSGSLFSLLQLDVANIASNSSSYFIRARKDLAEYFTVDIAGNIVCSGNINPSGAIQRFNTVLDIQNQSLSAANLIHTRFSNAAFGHSSGTAVAVQISPTINQSSSAGYTGLKIAITESATGSGNKRLIDCYSGTLGTTNVFSVTNSGLVNATNATFAAGTITTNTPVTISQTWNAAATFLGLVLDVTSTQSNATSRILQVNVGGSETAVIDRSGRFLWHGGSAAAPSYSFLSESSLGMYRVASGVTGFASGGVLQVQIGGTGSTLTVQDATASTGVTKLLVKSGANQSTTNLTEWQDNAGSVIASLGSTAVITTTSSATGNRLVIANSAGTWPLVVYNANSDVSPVWRVMAGNTNNYINFIDDMGYRGQTGHTFSYGGSNYQLLKLSNTEVLVQNQTASTGSTKLTVKAGAGQSTTNLQEWQDNSGGVLSKIASTGSFSSPDGSATACGHSFTSATNTGMYRTGGGNLAFAISGTAYAIINPAGLIISGQTDSSSSGTTLGYSYTKTYSQSSTAGSTDVKIVRTETALGSGTHRLIDCYAGSAGTTNVFYVDNSGNITGQSLVASSTVNTQILRSTANNQNLIVQSRDFSSAGPSLNFATGSYNASTAISQVITAITPTVSQTGSATGYTALKIAVTETAVLGTNSLIDCYAGASGTTQKFIVSNAGGVGMAGNLQIPIGTTVIDTSRNLLNLGSIVRAGSGSGLSFQTNASSTQYIGITTTGKVGIGQANTSPTVTLSVYDATASTGVTTVAVKAGAGQSTTNLQEWQNNSGTALANISSNGYIDGARHYITAGAGGYWSATSLQLPSNSTLLFSTTTNASATCDIGLSRSATNTLKITDGSSGTGNIIFQQGTVGNVVANNNLFRFDNGNGVELGSGCAIKFSSTSTYSGTKDIGISRSAAGLLAITDGSTGLGGICIATKTPLSASDTGTTGQIAWDENYIYVCTATNTWKRTAIATW